MRGGGRREDVEAIRPGSGLRNGGGWRTNGKTMDGIKENEKEESIARNWHYRGTTTVDVP